MSPISYGKIWHAITKALHITHVGRKEGNDLLILDASRVIKGHKLAYPRILDASRGFPSEPLTTCWAARRSGMFIASVLSDAGVVHPNAATVGYDGPPVFGVRGF